jgi:hypothetical protein
MTISPLKSRCAVILLASLGWPACSYAHGDIVYDPTVAADIVKQTKQDLDVLNETLDQGVTLKNQLAKAQQQYEAIVGQYGAGTWNMQGQAFTNNWQWTATNWQDQLKGLSGGNSARYQQLLDQYKEANDSMTEDEFHQTFSAQTAKALANQVSANQAVGTSSQLSFEKINDHVTELQQLGSQVESSDSNPNSKSAIDINTRAQIQNGLISAEMVRMQTAANNMAASQQAAQLAQAAESAKFNQIPTNP